MENIIILLLYSVLGGYSMLMLLRAVLRITQADFYNPVVQKIVRMTNPLVRPFARYCPHWKRVDTTPIIIAFLLQILMLLALAAVRNYIFSVGQIIGLSAIILAWVLLKIYLYSVILSIIASWVAPGSRHRLIVLAETLLAPVLNPIRARFGLSFGGVDFSPMLLIFAIQIFNGLLSTAFKYSGVPIQLFLLVAAP